MFAVRWPGAAQGLPGGARSLTEEHGSWILTCAQAEQDVSCLVRQKQTEPSSQQPVLAVELTSREATGGLDGVLVLPFGLALDQGVTLELREAGVF